MTINIEITLKEYMVYDNIVTDVGYEAVITHTDYPGAEYKSGGLVPTTELLIASSEYEDRKSEIMEKIRNGINVMMPTLPMMIASIYRQKNAEYVAAGGMIEFKTQYKQRVDMDAETCRLKFITPGAGQAMTYQQKVDEARKCVEDAEPTPEKYPMLASELGITGETLSDVANVIISMNEMWRVVGSSIEQIRLSAKKSIDEATDTQTIINIYKGLVWPEP